MEKIKLNENWRMRCLNNGRISSEWQNAVVPGSVYTDLLRNHQIQDPYWKDNEDSVCALMEEEYEYELQVEREQAAAEGRAEGCRGDRK